jgi:SAM-dependent methyltransferase
VERRLMRGFFAALDASLPREAPATVLEVGMGEGEVSGHVRRRFPQARVVGVDLPDPTLAEWRERGLRGVFADIARLPFPSGSFDLVLAIEVLEHVHDPDGALVELARLCRSDLVVSVPREPIWRIANVARGKYLRALGNTPGHVQHWSTRRFAASVGARFDVTSVRRPFPWTMVAARSHRVAPRPAITLPPPGTTLAGDPPPGTTLAGDPPPERVPVAVSEPGRVQQAS